jgi:hypothetical protein
MKEILERLLTENNELPRRRLSIVCGKCVGQWMC